MSSACLGSSASRAGIAQPLALIFWLLVCIAGLPGSAFAQARACFSTALVFAIDASGSIDEVEYRLQLTGLSDALRDPDVAEAVAASGGVALAAVVWSDAAMTARRIPWHPVRNRADIERFARLIRSLPRVGGGGTDLGQGVTDALDLLNDPELCAMRRIIDVSGDGAETHYPRRRNGVSIMSARRRAKEAGVTVNGLAIVDDEPNLERYYLDNLVVGHGAFVIVAETIDDFGSAMRTKLLREITPVNQARLPDAEAALERRFD